MQTNKKAPEGANKIFQADSNTIARECQLESFKKLDNAKRCRMILSQLDKPRTAREIAYRLGFFRPERSQAEIKRNESPGHG